MQDSGIGHVIGRADSGGWSANTAQDSINYLQYGPYTTQTLAGAQTAFWSLLIDNNTANGDGGPVLELQVNDATKGGPLLAVHDVNRHDFTAANQFQTFTLPFTLPAASVGDKLEFRVYWDKKAYIREQTVSLLGPPTGLAATPGSASVSLLWGAVTGATGYNVYRSATHGGPYTKVNTSAVTSPAYIDAGLANGTTYYYVVTAVTGAGESGYSGEASATPSAAFGLRVNAGGPNYTDAGHNVWSEDEGFSGGSVTMVPGTTTIAGTSDPTLYRTQRAGASFGYALPVPNGSYTLSLLFAEIGSDTGTNSFGATANGSSLFTGFNVYTAAGGADKALIRQFPVTVTNGQLSLNFAATTGTASLSALQLLPATFTGVTDVPPPGWAMGAVPTDDGSDSDGAGPSSSIGVSLPALVSENTPGPDLWAYNPLGPGASYERMYRSALAAAGHAAPGLSVGWTDNYDMAVTSATPTAWGALTLTYPDGAQERFTPALSGGVPTGQFSQPTTTAGLATGAPYFVTGMASATTGQWTSVTLTFSDHSKLTFTPAAVAATNPLYLFTKTTNLVGHSVTINRDAAANGYRVMSVQNDAPTPTPLLQFSYSGGTLASVKDLSSSNANDGTTSGGQNRQVNYLFNGTGGSLSDVSQIGPIGATPPDRWSYGYQTISGKPYLNTVQAPNPASPGSLSAATINYDANGHVQSVVNAADIAGKYRKRTYTPGTSGTAVNAFNADGTLAQTWQPNFVGPYHTDAGFTDANAKSDTLSYSDTANPYMPTKDVNRNTQTTSLTYDQFGNPQTVTTPRGDVVTNTYVYTDFFLGELMKSQETYPAGGVSKQATTFDYFPSGGPLYGLVKDIYSPAPDSTFGSPATVTTTFAYTSPVFTGAATAGGQVATVTAPGNNTNASLTTTYNYTTDGAFTQNESLGEPLTVTDPAGDITHFRYDGRGNVVQETDPSGYVTSYVYNLADQLHQVIYPITTGPKNAVMQYNHQYVGGPLASEQVYDEGGNPVREVDTAYTAEGEVAAVTGSTEPASYTYDGRSRVSALTDGDANTTRYAYDSLGDLLQTAYPGFTGAFPATAGTADTETLAYDLDQNLTGRTDGRGVVTTYARVDPESLVTGVSYANLPAAVTPIGTTAFQYDVFGRRSQMTDVTGTTNYPAYDDLDELLSLSKNFAGGPQGQGLTWAHYPDGSLRQMGTPGASALTNPLTVNGGAFTYTYDGAGRLKSVTVPFTGASLLHSYFANGWLQKTDNVQMPGTIRPATRSFYTYNARGFLTSLSNYLYDPTSGVNTTASLFSAMTYDALGNRLTETATIPAVPGGIGSAPDASRKLTFGYDTANATARQNRDVLAGEGSALTESGSNLYNDVYTNTFLYDPAYNTTQFAIGGMADTFGHNPDNQISNTGYGFDGDGNPTTYQATVFTFDPEDRLTGIASPAFKARYDGDGLRAWKQGAGAATYFLNDGSGQPVLEETFSGTSAGLLAVNLFGADGWRARYYPTGAGGNQFFAFSFDPQGNVVQRQNGSNAVSYAYDTASYEGYGRRGADYSSGGSNPAASQDPARFGGQFGYYTDTETGLLCLTHRYYDPGTGRFLNRDPAGYGGGVNLYGFAGDNPINEMDPEGTNALTRYLGRQWSRLAHRFMGGGVSGPHIGQGHGDVGLDPDEEDAGGVPPLDAHPQQSGRNLRAGERQVVGTVAGAIASAPLGGEGAAEERAAEEVATNARLLKKYGQAGSRQLADGRMRYYGNITPARTPGLMAGLRKVREWNPATNKMRTWFETLDHAGNIRQVRPETGGSKIHYMFDAGGRYIGRR